ncbi:nucleotidyl transferase AbiEii/AbiGii toxin family protein [Salinicola endophyticus]|nr:nucleotidyl transferase AbiEii/AbiGii toxin family protein [Salinicola endophyticus]
MTAISLTLTSPLEPSVRDTLGDMNTVAAALGIDYVLIGATARDIVLHHLFGAPRPRATRDIDFAIYVRDWDDYRRVRHALVGRGYTPEREPHRLHSPQGDTLDLLPFGGVAAGEPAIAWPPDGAVVMSVMGFAEACRSAYRVSYPAPPEITFKVANLESQILLKLVSWSERTPAERRKDAADIAYLLQHYWREDQDQGTLWQAPWLARLEANDHDHALVSLQLLGQRAARIANADTLAHVTSLLEGTHPQRSLETLAIEMGRASHTPTDTCLGWLDQLHQGFLLV